MLRISRCCATLLLSFAASVLPAQDFRGVWPSSVSRPWAGPDYWANPLQDWRIRGGRLENFVPGGDRNVFLLTREINARPGSLEMSVALGRLEGDTTPLGDGFVGFRVGIRGYFRDYRDSAVRGEGLNAGMASDGRLFVGKLEAHAAKVAPPFRNIVLRLRAEPNGANYRVDLEARSSDGRALAALSAGNLPASWFTGGIALVCSSGPVAASPPEGELIPGFGQKRGTERGGTLRFWFRDWRVSGTKLDIHEERAFGPILFAMHTLSRGVLKLTAQMAPVEDSSRTAVLEVRKDGVWRTVGKASPDPLSRTATFRVPNWDDTRDTPYRVRYGGQFYGGAIRKDPRNKPRIIVAAFTGNNDLGFPHADIVRNVAHFRPDLLYFTGDNIYERVGEYGIERAPIETAALDYLRKWYLFGWEYRELLKEIPAVCLPDDHDVYHGNLWGAGGRKAVGAGQQGQDSGGYTMPAEWVNAVQRTQTSHLPDPYDPAPVAQGITVYYSHLLYGGLSTAILEDRKWKSAPKELLPKARIANGWPQAPEFDAARDGDVPGAELLGPRQLAFLNVWAADWSGGAWMKTVVSQTVFADICTLPRGVRTDDITPMLRVMQPGEYPDNEEPVMDHDSNGWPRTGRNQALRAMRRGLAFHIAGDQHLGSTVQYGIDEFNDAGWAICVPSVANVWPRRWFPPRLGGNSKPGAPRYTGEYFDGFGNRMTVHAVSNPTAAGVEPAALHDRAPGYGIVTFDRATRRITMANWPRWVDPAAPDAKPYAGWPITVHQFDNGLPRSGWTLDRIEAPGTADPVVQVIEEPSGEIVYTLRVTDKSFAPPVFHDGSYTVKVMDPDRGRETVRRHLRPRRR